MIKVLKVENAHTLPKLIDVENTLASLQKEVNGFIEICHYFEDVVLIVNEEGKLNGMKPTRALCDRKFNISDILFGPILIAADDGEDLVGLSEEQIGKYTELFSNEDAILTKNNGVISLVTVG